jgi:hypothetical protein
MELDEGTPKFMNAIRSAIDTLDKGLRGESFKATLCLYAVVIVLLAPFSVFIASIKGSAVACVIIILSATLFPILIWLLVSLLSIKKSLYKAFEAFFIDYKSNDFNDVKTRLEISKLLLEAQHYISEASQIRLEARKNLEIIEDRIIILESRINNIEAGSPINPEASDKVIILSHKDNTALQNLKGIHEDEVYIGFEAMEKALLRLKSNAFLNPKRLHVGEVDLGFEAMERALLRLKLRKALETREFTVLIASELEADLKAELKASKLNQPSE